MKTILKIVFLLVITLITYEQLYATSLEIAIHRTNYIRGEVISVSIRGESPLGKVKLFFKDEKNSIVKEYIKESSSENLSFEIDTCEIASGKYNLSVESKRGKGNKEIEIIPRKPPFFPFGICAGVSLKSKEDIEEKIERLAKRNITLLQLHPWETFNLPFLLDVCTKYGIEFVPVASVYYNLKIAAKYPEERMKYSNGKDKPAWVNPNMPTPCFLSKHNREKISELLKKQIEAVRDYPSFKNHMLINDDVQMVSNPMNNLMVCYCNNCKNRFKDLTGLDAPLPSPEILKKRGIIPDNDPWYLWMKFRCKDVMGDYNKFLVEEKNKIAPEIKLGPAVQSIFEPYWGTSPADYLKPFGLLSSYRYPGYSLPSWAQLMQIDLMLMDNREGKDIAIIAGAVEADWVLNYLGSYGWIREAEERGKHIFEYMEGKKDTEGHPYFFKVHYTPAYYRAQFYSLLAGGAKMISWFGAPKHEYDFNWEELKKLGEVVKKYGSLFLKLERVPAKVGLFASFTARAYEAYEIPSDNRDPWKSLNALEDAYRTFLQAQIPVEMVSEEEILSGRLKQYKVLILPNISVMRKSVYREIKRYIKQGGIVYYDTSTEVKIKGAKKLSLDFTDWFRYLMDNNYRRAWWDSLDFHRIKAEEIKKIFYPIVKPFATSDSSNLIIKESEGNGVKYLWVINADMENSRTVTIKLKGKHSHINDVFSCKFLPSFYLEKENLTKLSLGLAPGSGKLLALYPERIDKIEIDVPDKVKRKEKLEIKISLLDRNRNLVKGIQPTEIRLISPGGKESEYGGYFAVENGRKVLTYTIALNDKIGKWKVRVEELGSGRKREAIFEVE